MSDEFDMERLQELHGKAQHNDLSPEEIRELNAMLNDFVETMTPVIRSLVDVYSTALEDMVESLQPLAELAEDSHE